MLTAPDTTKGNGKKILIQKEIQKSDSHEQKKKHLYAEFTCRAVVDA